MWQHLPCLFSISHAMGVPNPKHFWTASGMVKIAASPFYWDVVHFASLQRYVPALWIILRCRIATVPDVRSGRPERKRQQLNLYVAGCSSIYADGNLPALRRRSGFNMLSVGGGRRHFVQRTAPQDTRCACLGDTNTNPQRTCRDRCLFANAGTAWNHPCTARRLKTILRNKTWSLYENINTIGFRGFRVERRKQ